MKARLSFCLLLFACSSSAPPPSNGRVYVIPTKDPDFSIEPTKPVRTERETVEAYVSPILKDGTTKVVVGILEKGETRIYPFGDGANADTMFELGSFTRVFTALLLADAFARQEIPKLSTPVAELLPPGVELPSKDITLRHLATESSGLGFLEFRLGLLDDRLPAVDDECVPDHECGSVRAHPHHGCGNLFRGAHPADGLLRDDVGTGGCARPAVTPMPFTYAASDGRS